MPSIISGSGKQWNNGTESRTENRNRECDLHAHMYFLSFSLMDEDKLKFH